jgi:hypothetical protein
MSQSPTFSAEVPRRRIDPKTIVIAPPAGRGAEERIEQEQGSSLPAGLTEKKEKEATTPPATPFAPFPTTNGEFIAAIFGGQPEHGTPLVCSKSGSPEEGGWLAVAALDVNRQCPATHNNYFNCSSFKPNDGGKLRAVKEQFGAYHTLMLDDVGTKVAEERLGAFSPSWKIETSPGNYQVGIVLDPPLTDPADVERLQHAVVQAGLSDPGAKGLARWARFPNGINGKEKYRCSEGKAFQSSLVLWRPEQRYSMDQLVSGLGLNPTAAPGRTASTAGKAAKPDNEVCTYPKAINPVVSALQARGLYKRQIGPGKHDIACPWVAEHTDALDTGACYWDPDQQHKVGGFKCLHSHGERLSINDLLNWLDVTPGEARNRTRIRVVAGAIPQIVSAAEEALAATGRLFHCGGAIVAVRKDPQSGDLRLEQLTAEALTAELAKAAEWERYDGRGNQWVPTDPQARHVNLLLRGQQFSHLPNLRGLARQPYMRPQDAELVLEPGYDRISELYGQFDPKHYSSIEPTRMGAEAALSRLMLLLEEFHFANEADRSAALGAMLTAVVRPSLPVAPAFNITASGPGSGKSYLAALIAKFATAGEPHNVSYPRTSEEATKAVLASLLQAPAVILFDDMDRDWEPHGSINRMLTSQTISDRLLGGNKSATVSTQCLVMGTGNNVEPQRDLRRRVISIRLAPQTASPALLSYKGRPLEAVVANRDRYVADALTIIQGWMRAGSPRSPAFPIASYGDAWSDLCRQPLLWLGLPDPAVSLQEQLRCSPDDDQLLELLTAWHALYREQSVTVRKLLDNLGSTGAKRLREAIEDLPVAGAQGVNRSSFGWYLKKKLGRIVGSFKLEQGSLLERTSWRVVTVSDQTSPAFASFEGGEGGKLPQPSRLPPS